MPIPLVNISTMQIRKMIVSPTLAANAIHQVRQVHAARSRSGAVTSSSIF